MFNIWYSGNDLPACNFYAFSRPEKQAYDGALAEPSPDMLMANCLHYWRNEQSAEKASPA